MIDLFWTIFFLVCEYCLKIFGDNNGFQIQVILFNPQIWRRGEFVDVPMVFIRTFM